MLGRVAPGRASIKKPHYAEACCDRAWRAMCMSSDRPDEWVKHVKSSTHESQHSEGRTHRHSPFEGSIAPPGPSRDKRASQRRPRQPCGREAQDDLGLPESQRGGGRGWDVHLVGSERALAARLHGRRLPGEEVQEPIRRICHIRASQCRSTAYGCSRTWATTHAAHCCDGGTMS